MFKYPAVVLALLVSCCISCRNGHEKLVDPLFADSLIVHYTLPAAVASNEQELQFWSGRIDPKNPGMVNESKYAATLVARFHLLGDIRDVKKADSIQRKVDTLFNHKEAGPNHALVGISILQHRFTEADSFLVKAKVIGLKRYEWLCSLFDVSFEIGRYDNALIAVNQLKADADYGYYFRRAKMDHLNGSLDSSIGAMLKAAELAENSLYLRQVALSNAADLYIHAGRLKEARDLYMQCIRMNSADFHSITGLGWIALVNDKNDTLAGRLFQLVKANNKLPDPLFRLSQMAEATGNSLVQLGYAGGFTEAAATAPYGNMYNKYLIELYTGIIKEPDLAVLVAKRELGNRATPQTYAWYAWALAAAGKKDEAYKVFQEHVSGKPLEGLELYWMGKLMQQLNKGYNATEFFKAAWKNKYDLSPGMMKDLESMDL